jgi:flap endonuclease-1
LKFRQDVLVYEAPLLRNISNRAVPLIVVSGSEVRTVLQLERASYVDFALLLGTDFSQRIKNVGPHRALKFIREHGTIERILEHEPKFPPALPAEDYLEQVQAARMIFRTLPPVPGENIMQQGESNNDEVVEILQRCGLQRATMIDWDYASALAGNFFEDDPTAYSHTHY